MSNQDSGKDITLTPNDAAALTGENMILQRKVAELEVKVQELMSCSGDRFRELLDAQDRIAELEAENAALRVIATRWVALEVLMINGSLVELKQEEDGDYSISLEGVECTDQLWRGDMPEEVIDKVVKQLGLPESATPSSPAMTSHIELAPGELYIGRINDTHIILLPGDNDAAAWQEQMDWAKSIGGDLPNRIEQAMLWANFRDQFQKDWYWSNEQHASASGYAWYQHFRYGSQDDRHKLYELRARAVRRVEVSHGH